MVFVWRCFRDNDSFFSRTTLRRIDPNDVSSGAELRELPELVSADEWPPMSPDLNPMDYSMWGVLEASVAARNVKSLDRLRLVVQEEWDKMPMKIVRAAIDWWPDRIGRCI